VNKIAAAATIALVTTVGTYASEQTELTVERLESSPRISGPRVIRAKVAPDGKRVTFLRGKETDFEQLDLWEYHVEDDETRLLVDSESLVPASDEELSEEEIARRERKRLRGKGIVEYYWDEQGRALLFPLGGDLFHLPLGGAVRRLTETEEFETDIRISPRGRYASFIRERDLYIVEIESGKETRLTSGADETIAHGVAEFVAQEELSRYTGYWWSDDESRIAYTRIDESPVDLVQRYEVNADGSVTTRGQRYPVAGSQNARVELWVVELANAKRSQIDLGDEAEFYLARVDWLPDSRTLAFQRLPRRQQSLDLVFAPADGSNPRTVLREESDVWINLHDDLHFLKDTKRFLWTSERSGYRQIYLYSTDGKELGALTRGDWVVANVLAVDEAAGLVYFTGFADNTLERHLYAVPLDPDPDALRRITREEGWHGPSMARGGGSVFLDLFSSPTQPTQAVVRSTGDGTTRTFIVENRLDENHPYHPYLSRHATSRFGRLPGADGSKLDYRMLLPPGFDESRKYPVVLAPYGGPHGHRVAKRWGIGINQILAREGFVVLTVDNRGSYHRGVAFEAPLKNGMGAVEVEDQVAAVDYLRGLPFIDGERIGIHGWSYGGYMTLMCLFKAPSHFRAGVSGAPVTNWRLYDTAYTERYLGLPDDPGDVYSKSSVFEYIDGFEGRLLVIHGMADDNVFFDNTVQLIAALQRKKKPFELMTYPGQRHRFGDREMRIHRVELTVAFLKKALQ
jgi:dipeptidyl-peptidase-4